jgi:hypothetical protein
MDIKNENSGMDVDHNIGKMNRLHKPYIYFKKDGWDGVRLYIFNKNLFYFR